MMNTKCIVAAAFGLAFAAFGDNTTWYFNSYVNLRQGLDVAKNASGGNLALSNLSYWTNSLGQVGSGAPTASDDLVFDNNITNRLRYSATSFSGNSLQIGTDAVSITVVHDGGGSDTEFGGAGLKLKKGDWFFNSGPGVDKELQGDVEVLAESAAAPFVLHYGQAGYSNGVGRITGKLIGSADAQLWLGPWTGPIGNMKVAICAQNSTFCFYDISQYAGTITVKSAFENAGSDFGTRLRFHTGTQTSPAKICVKSGGSLTMSTFGDTVTVKELSLEAGSRLWFNQMNAANAGKLWCIRATDALTVNAPVELYMPIIRGIEHYRIPILAGPAGSTFTTNDFSITYSQGQYNLDLYLEVANDPVTGDRTLYVVSRGFVIQTASYGTEGSRGGGADTPSSITNDAAWWGGFAPNPTNSAAVYRTASNLSTPYAPTERYEFPCAWFWLNGGSLSLQTKTFEVPEFYCDGSNMVAVANGHENVTSQKPVRLVAPHIHVFKADATMVIRAYRGNSFVIDGEIDGPGYISIYSWDNTASPTAYYELTGMNTNFTGSISVSQGEYRSQYISFGSKFPTLYVNDGRNLGGRKDAFDPRALKLTHMARLSVTNNGIVTLADGLNRGVYILEKGRFNVTNAPAVLDVQWPLLLSGKMWKEGLGTLILGREMKHEVDDGGALSDTPRAGSNLFEIVAGTVKIAHADALAGVETTIDAGASIQLVLDPDDADLMKYGIRNTAVDTPFTLDPSFGGKMPLTVDVSAVPPPANGAVATNGILTVKSTAAAAVGEMLAGFGRVWKGAGVSSRIVPIQDGATTTFAAISKRTGVVFTLR